MDNNLTVRVGHSEVLKSLVDKEIYYVALALNDGQAFVRIGVHLRHHFRKLGNHSREVLVEEVTKGRVIVLGCHYTVFSAHVSDVVEAHG